MPSVSLSGRDLDDVPPQLFAFRLIPTVIALEYGDEELHCAVNDLGEGTIDGFHRLSDLADVS